MRSPATWGSRMKRMGSGGGARRTPWLRTPRTAEEDNEVEQAPGLHGQLQGPYPTGFEVAGKGTASRDGQGVPFHRPGGPGALCCPVTDPAGY